MRAAIAAVAITVAIACTSKDSSSPKGGGGSGGSAIASAANRSPDRGYEHAIVALFAAKLMAMRSGHLDGVSEWLDRFQANVRLVDDQLDPEIHRRIDALADVLRRLVRPDPDREQDELSIRSWAKTVAGAPPITDLSFAGVGPVMVAELTDLHMAIDGVTDLGAHRAEYEQKYPPL